MSAMRPGSQKGSQFNASFKRRNTVNTLNKKDLARSNIMGLGSVYAPSQASGSEFGDDDRSMSQAAAPRIFGINRELYKPSTALQ